MTHSIQAIRAAPLVPRDVARTSGEPLPPAMRSAVETRFGHDFSAVRIHADASAAAAARSLGASAYTIGRDIVFGDGQYAPATAVGRRLQLTVRNPRDSYEREADRIADQVMSAPAHHGFSSVPVRSQRSSGQPGRQLNAMPARVAHTLADPGTPLEPAVRQDMEQRFGHDFSGVRVHSGAAAEQSAEDVNAHAYTVGQHVVFGAGGFAPGTREGLPLLAHELTHVVQQAECGVASLQCKKKETEGGWLTLAAAAERLSKASLLLYQQDPLLTVIEPEGLLERFPMTGVAQKSKMALRPAQSPMEPPSREKIESPFSDYTDLQKTLRTFETALVSYLRDGATEILNTTEAGLHVMYNTYVGEGPHLSWLENVHDPHGDYGTFGPGWIEAEIEKVKADPDVIKLQTEHVKFKTAKEDERSRLRWEGAGRLNRELRKEQQEYNELLRQVLKTKSPKLFFVRGFDVSGLLYEKSSDIAQNKLMSFIADSGLKVRDARRHLGDRRFLYGADLLIEKVKKGLAEELRHDPSLFRSVPEPVLSLPGEERPLGSWLERPPELARRADTLNWIIDQLVRERKAETTLWEDIVNVLQVLSTFVPGPIGWGIRQFVTFAKFDIAIGREGEQRIHTDFEFSAETYDPNAGLGLFGEALVQGVTDVPPSLAAKGATRLLRTTDLERSAAGEAAHLAERRAGTALREGEESVIKQVAAKPASTSPGAKPAETPRVAPQATPAAPISTLPGRVADKPPQMGGATAEVEVKPPVPITAPTVQAKPAEPSAPQPAPSPHPSGRATTRAGAGAEPRAGESPTPHAGEGATTPAGEGVASAAHADAPPAQPSLVPLRSTYTPPTEEAVAARTTKRISATDRGRGARPFYAKDPKSPAPKPPKSPRVKLLSMGERRSSAAQWFLRNADRAEVKASTKGYQVYEYYARDGRCLYVGRSGGAAEKAGVTTEKALEAPKKATNWIDRGWSHIEEERREIAEADRIVVHAELNEAEAKVLEHDRITQLKPELNVLKGEAASRTALGPDYGSTLQSAQKRPTFRFDTDIVPPSR
jgi:hypothetical protein